MNAQKTAIKSIFSPAIRLMLVATFTFALMNVLVKSISHIPAVEIVFFRAVITLFLSWITLRQQKVKVWGKNHLILILRGVFGTAALLLFFITLQEIPLATASLVFYLKPIFTAIIASIILREKIHPWQWFFFLLSFGGVVLMKGFDSRVSLLHLGMGIIAGVFAGGAYNCIRYLKTSEHPVVIVFYFPLVAMPLTGAMLFWWWVTPSFWDLWVLLGIGILTQIAQVLMTKAYQLESAARVASMNYLGIIYALSFGFVFFQETFNFWVLMGMVLVVTGVLLNISIQALLKNSTKARKISA